MKEPLVIQTTLESLEDAKKLAEKLLQQRLAACVQVDGPVESMYWWNGAIESAQEYRLSIKTFTDLYPEAEKMILREHPYDVPEIVALKLSRVSDSYRSWMAGETGNE